MVTFDALLVNDTTIKVDNRTDYYLDDWIYTDYGFEIFYRPGRGVDEQYWNELLIENGFTDPDSQYRGKVPYFQLETRATDLEFTTLLTRTFCLEFTSGGNYYSMLYDHPRAIILMKQDWSYRDRI